MTKSKAPPLSLSIEPTQADIVTGTCNSPTKCMYAMALRRMFPRATYISVNTNCVTMTMDGMYYHYMIPKKAVKNIVIYDDTKTVDLKKAKVSLELADKRMAKYKSTPETREYHRKKSARRRANPDYVRPDSKQTLRAQLAEARLVRQTG